MPPRPANPKIATPPPAAAPHRAPAWLRPLLLALTAILFLTWFTRRGRRHRYLASPDDRAATRWKPARSPSRTRSATPATSTSAAYPGEAKTRYFNLTHEWLAQILMYVIHAATGFPGLVLSARRCC